MRTYQVRYKQFPRSRRIHTLHVEADSIQNARINFLKAINLAKNYNTTHRFGATISVS
ncbi:MAG: hypothetical protein WBK78_01630 [Syntrophomonadaceae bacterium]